MPPMMCLTMSLTIMSNMTLKELLNSFYVFRYR